MDGWVLFFQERAEVDPASLGRFSLCKIKDGASVVATIGVSAWLLERLSPRDDRDDRDDRDGGPPP